MGNRNWFFGALGKGNRFRTGLRWVFYSAALLVFYMVMAGGFFRGWQPVLIIPLAVAVAMREGELSASIFGAVCGLVIDIACGKLFGFTAACLMLGCLAAALLVSHLIKVNLLNFIWVNAAICALTAAADYFFRYVLFNTPNSYIILGSFIFPSHFSAVVVSPLIYLGIKFISIKLSPHEQIRLSNFANSDDED